MNTVQVFLGHFTQLTASKQHAQADTESDLYTVKFPDISADSLQHSHVALPTSGI